MDTPQCFQGSPCSIFPRVKVSKLQHPNSFIQYTDTAPTTEYLLCIGINWKSTATGALEKVLELYQEKVLQYIFNKHDFKDKVCLLKKRISPTVLAVWLGKPESFSCVFNYSVLTPRQHRKENVTRMQRA